MADGGGRPAATPTRPAATPPGPAGGSASDGDGAASALDAAGEVANAPGWREVLTVGGVVVAVVLALAVLTSVLPASLQDVVFHTPLAIVVLVVGTLGLLLWVARRPSPRL